MVQKIIKVIVFVITIISIFFLFLSFPAWYVSPLRTSFFSFMGIAFPIILIVNVLCLLFWIILKKWKVALIIVIGLIVCYKPITTFFPLNFKSQSIPEKSLKVLTYNVMGFLSEAQRNSAHPLLEYVAKIDADIVCLQEYMISKTGKSLLTQKDVEKVLSKYPYRSITGLEYSGKYHTYGLACFSKYPITSTREFTFESSFNGAAVYTIDVNGETYLVANNHLESNKISDSDKKLYGDFLVKRNSETLTKVTSNIRRRLGRGYNKRATQVQTITDYLDRQEYDKLIVCGDFNDTPISYAYKKMKGDLNDAYTSTGFGPGITYYEKFFLFRIDYILHSKNLKAHKTTVDRVKFSDHYPVLTYLTEQ
ncbi:MAG: endonuclease/exonuclease/phosphatase family protein [Dysgonamonadaceae bacterium]|nr:endonuclease/exonuclease/phosphatase family protein [Dysgonamonadaceae bacterium]MDD3356295.1 endonuclease/exonuclease/phosphatase family protein [Dysgonamonadaceae bacterium]MDD3727842.1 endonuclease/exonuclease/phosphatase family protein [Dysgonamonadaceae bacterium]MDD4246725.1 endonuclease/exonuclease/phosphatase family protein [Dysgonamonadaceae bacterium]